ncbi:ERCC4 domain-containing protein [Gaiella sp.]|jgi:Fanconi anemia group M protein|uniref:ERCC4 domain-containing protein n=1 Tax=Gaiella sp. TaxID=2663207 RepID=UPI002E30E469|nr:ERCC4 domain-containing protein [Gaiella sp.]HEX5582295.1 ERCC4 domain-containing protein [Gaiella sp.]
MAETVRIIADVQERRSGIPKLLAELGAEVEVLSLTAGDYVVGHDTLVERKAVLDLHSAVRRGHLWAQLAKLKAGCPFPYLLVEGRSIDGRGRGLHPNSIRGACLAVIDQGVALLRSDDRADSARWIHRLAVRCQREASAPELPPLVPRPVLAPESVPEAMLAAVPGISTVTARALLERFGSLTAVATAPPDALLDVPGIGNERARALLEALGGAPPAAERPSTQWSEGADDEPAAKRPTIR